MARKVPRELVQAFTPTGAAAQRAAFRGRTPAQQAAANIKSTAQAAQRIAREQDVSFEEAAGILRQTAVSLKRAQVAFGQVAARQEKIGRTQPLLVDEATSLLSRRMGRTSGLQRVQGQERTELARFVAEEEARRPTTSIRVFRTEAERNRRLLGIRR